MTKEYKADAMGRNKRAYRLIKNSEVIKVGDWIVDESTGMANADGTSELIAGFATAIVTIDKRSLEALSVVTGDLGGTWAASTKSYTAASDNETVDGVMVEYVPAREGDQFIGTLDADKGTTTGSNKAGYWISVLTTDSSLLDESSAAASATQFRIVDAYNQGSDTEIIVEVVIRGNE